MDQKAGRSGPGDGEIGPSALLLSEQTLGAIFGWDQVAWPVVQQHKGKRFYFEPGRAATTPAIYPQLKPLFDRGPDPDGGYPALQPSPVVNRHLNRLVELVCCHFGTTHLAGDAARPALTRSIAEEQLHEHAVGRLLARIADDAALRERAATVKRIAAAAECEMEKRFCDIINQRIERDFPPRDDGLLALKLAGLRASTAAQRAASEGRNRAELAGLAMPVLPQADRQTAIEMVRSLLHLFPYFRNYELMLLAELALLQRPARPCFVPDRRLSAGGAPVAMADLARVDAAVAALIAALQAGRPADVLARPDAAALGRMSFAFCGSGAMPLSGLMLHLLTGATVTLIDRDPAAVARSRRLIGHLERLEVIPAGALTVIARDIGDCRFCRPGSGAADRQAIACDAVFLASLIATEVKCQIAQRLRDDPLAPDFLIVRSARGLGASLIYDPAPCAQIGELPLIFCGEALPACQVSTRLERAAAASGPLASLHSRDLVVIAHPSVVNSTELYQRPAVALDGCRLDLAGCRDAAAIVARLDAARAQLG